MTLVFLVLVASARDFQEDHSHAGALPGVGRGDRVF